MSRHPAVALSVLVALAFTGFALAPRLPLEREPQAAGTALVVEASLPGIDAAEVERLVVPPIEAALVSLPRVQRILARSNEGRAAIQISFESSAERERALETVRERVAELVPQLPRGMDPPVVERDDPPLRAAAVFAVTARPITAEVVKWLEQALRRPLQELAQTSFVAVDGADTVEILVQPDMRRLATLGLSFEDIAQALRRTDAAPVRGGARRVGTAASASAEAIAARPVQLPSGETVALAEMAEVSIVRHAATDVPRHQGEPALWLRVYPQSARSAAEVAERADAHLAWLRANGQVPAGVTVHKRFDEADETRKWFRRVLKRVGVVLALSLLVVLGLLGVRRTVVTIAAFFVWMPLCAAALWVTGLSLNVVALAGMMLAAVTLVLAANWIGATSLVGVLALAAALLRWWEPVWLGVHAQAFAAFSVAALLAVLVAWLLSAWTPRGDIGSALVRRLPPGLRGQATLALAVLLLLGGSTIAVVRALPAAVTVVTGGSGVVQVSGPDEVRLITLTDNLSAALRALAGVSDISRSPVREEVWRLKLDSALLQEQGIGIAEVGRAFAIARDGLVVGELIDPDAQLPLRVQLAPGRAGAAFERLLLRGERPDQRAVYLRNVGVAAHAGAWSERIRVQGAPAAEVRFSWRGEAVPDGIRNLREAIALPDGYAMSVQLILNPA